MGGLSSFGPQSLDMYLPALPSLTQLTLTACLVGLALGQVIAGPLSDSFGRRGPLLIGLLGYAVASLLCVFAPSVPALVGLRLLQGVTGSAGNVIARAVVRDLYAGAAAALLCPHPSPAGQERGMLARALLHVGAAPSNKYLNSHTSLIPVQDDICVGEAHPNRIGWTVANREREDGSPS